MTTWEIKPRSRLRPNGQLSRRAPVQEAREPQLELLRAQALPQPATQRPATKTGGSPAWWQLPMVFVGEAVVWLIHHSLITETLETVGVEITKSFRDLVVLGWLFESVPQLTARDLLSAVTALVFTGVPIAVWLALMDEEPRRSAAHVIMRWFLFLSYVAVVTGEILLVLHRIGLASNNAFAVQSGHEPAIAVFFSLLLVIVTATCAFATASIYRARKQRRD